MPELWYEAPPITRRDYHILPRCPHPSCQSLPPQVMGDFRPPPFLHEAHPWGACQVRALSGEPCACPLPIETTAAV